MEGRQFTSIERKKARVGILSNPDVSHEGTPAGIS